MLILGIDTTTLSCSVALLQDEALLAEATLNIKKTHSERLMPLLDNLLKESGIERETINAIAVAAGPGSFTGLRIGVSTARALAQALGIPAVAVCTLDALAEAVPVPGTLICPLLDARRSQVYTALYRRNKENPHQLITLLQPTAIVLDDLIAAIISYNESVVFIGEGLNSYSAELEMSLPAGKAIIAPAPFRVCRASLVALAGRRLLALNPTASYREVLPIYLRQPEAERLANKNTLST
jgi:tRNA threonylcarbamoyladenosine biosynthesis protein TsaB